MTEDTAPDPSLVTPRLSLRDLAPEDAPVLARLVDDPHIARMTTSIPHPYPAEFAVDFIDRVAAFERSREAVFALDVPGTGFVGLLGFHPSPGDAPAGAVEVGFWLGRPFWGQGYMTEAVSAALIWASGSWGRRQVLAGHFADNPASAGVLIKAGFLYTGEVVRRHSLGRGCAEATRMMVWLA